MKKWADEQLGTTSMCQYFFVSVGKAKVSPKLCTECRDVTKNRKRYDYLLILSRFIFFFVETRKSTREKGFSSYFEHRKNPK